MKYHWKTKLGIKSLTQEQANAIQATELGHATKDLYEAIERGDYPEWELNVQIMSDDEHPELDFDPLDDTKTWPEDRFPLLPVGRMVLDRNPENVFAEVEQAPSAPACLLTGSNSRTTRCCRGAPSPTPTPSATEWGRTTSNCRSTTHETHVPPTSATAQMAYYVDGTGPNPKVNYEPNSTGGLTEAPEAGTAFTPQVSGAGGTLQDQSH